MSSVLRSPYWLFIVLLLLLAGLQYRFWWGEGGIRHTEELKRQIAAQELENKKLLEKNRQLEAQVIEFGWLFLLRGLVNACSQLFQNNI